MVTRAKVINKKAGPILLQSQVLTAGGAAVGCGWRSLHSQREKFVGGMKRNWNQRSWYSLMPKKVCVMCFFLPQVHRRKAQAQFPSFNRVARISLSFFKKMSQCKKQVGWPPLTCEQLTLDIRVKNRILSCFHKLCCFGMKRQGQDLRNQNKTCEIKNSFPFSLESKDYIKKKSC